MDKPFTLFVASFLVCSVLVPRLSQAYQTGTVSANGSLIKASPNDSDPSLGNLPKGTPLRLSDNPKDGYYKFKSSKYSGWIKVDSVVVAKTKGSTRKIASVQSKKNQL